MLRASAAALNSELFPLSTMVYSCEEMINTAVREAEDTDDVETLCVNFFGGENVSCPSKRGDKDKMQFGYSRHFFMM